MASVISIEHIWNIVNNDADNLHDHNPKEAKKALKPVTPRDRYAAVRAWSKLDAEELCALAWYFNNRLAGIIQQDMEDHR